LSGFGRFGLIIDFLFFLLTESSATAISFTSSQVMVDSFWSESTLEAF
jgi:hypothetical protein